MSFQEKKLPEPFYDTSAKYTLWIVEQVTKLHLVARMTELFDRETWLRRRIELSGVWLVQSE